MRTFITLIIVFALFGQSCSRLDEQFEKLLLSPNDYHGKVIEITGIIHERFDDNAIYLTGSSSTDKAVWIEYSMFGLLNTSVGGLDGKKLKVRGEFDKDRKGHLGQYAGTVREAVIIIEESKGPPHDASYRAKLSDSCKQVIASDSFYYAKSMIAQNDAIFKLENFLTEETDSQQRTIDFDCVIVVNRTSEQISELRKILGEDLDETLNIEAIHTKGAKCIIESNGMQFLEATGRFIQFTSKTHSWNLDLRKTNFPAWVFILYKEGKDPMVVPGATLTIEEVEGYFE